MFKKTIIGITALIFSTGAIFAQHKTDKFENKTPEELADLKTERLTERLSLTSDQEVLVHEILLKSSITEVEIQDRYPQMKEAKKEMQTLRAESKSQINEILTPEQTEKLKEKKRSNHKKMNKRDQTDGEKMDAKLEQMQSELGLTSEQMNELKPIFLEMKQQHEEMSNKYPELQQAKEELGENRKQTKAQIEKVLTVEQIELMKNSNGKKKRRK